MRTKHLLMLFAAAIAGGITLNYTNTATYERTYVPQNAVKEMYSADQFQEWLFQMKANQNTRNISPEMIAKANEEMKQFMTKSRIHQGFNWIEEGPNNVGGRTRSVLIDKDNPNVMWAGSVSGGIWKSTTGGQYWYKVDYSVAEGYTPTSVSSIAQTADGTIYFGTGEPFDKHFIASGTDNDFFTGSVQDVPLIKGGGIFKQQGDTFVRLESTSPSNSANFYGTRRLVAHPQNPNILLAATTTGLWETTNGGETWAKAIDVEGQSWDVAMGSDGTVIANIYNETYIRIPNSSTFESVSGTEEGKLPQIVGRYVYQILKSDPSCIFASISDSVGDLEGVFRTLNKGQTWEKIGFGHSSQFIPFGWSAKTGIFAHSLLALSKNLVLIAGVDVWRGSGVEGSHAFEWNKIYYSVGEGQHTAYIHSGIHDFAPHPSGTSIFAATDGGIYRIGSNGIQPMNTYYRTTLCYSADINSKGEIIVGTQDNGTYILKHDLPGSQYQYGRKIQGGNGTECLFSSLSDNVIISSYERGNMQRSNTGGDDFFYFWSSKMASDNGWSSDNLIWQGRNASWKTPVALWECDDFSHIRVDTSRVMAIVPYVCGVPYLIQSANVGGQMIWWTPDRDYEVGDTISFPDPYQAVFLFGMGNRIWYTKKALNFNPIERFDWWDIHNRTLFDSVGTSEPATRFVAVAFSPDGDIAYGATEPNHQDSAIIYRISNLHACTRPRHAAFSAYHAVLDSAISRITHVQKIGAVKGRYISSLETDPKNPEVLIVTMGQYGNEEHIYVAEHAASTSSTIWNDNFASIQGNLPKMPVYSACVNKNPYSVADGQLLVGTEHGVFITDNYLSSNVIWQEGNNGLGHYPVLSIKQRYNERKQPGIYTYGEFIIATYGRGVFTDTSSIFVGIEDPIIGDHNSADNSLNIKVFPNPASDIANISISVDNRSVIEIVVYDLTGKLVYSHKTSKLEAGTHNLTIPVSEFTQGTYLVQCISGNARKTEKLLVK
ncbi:MAG: T9SS type A sorting domain-containing protein [Salinivirgaceae bacterium]|jgi:hypothetical protein|nr:T9SS type A sorting domain-containing protein [Bacteroidales bacterium]